MAMIRTAFYGMMRDAELRRIVLNGDFGGYSGRISGYDARGTPPALVLGGSAQAWIVDLPAAAFERASYFARANDEMAMKVGLIGLDAGTAIAFDRFSTPDTLQTDWDYQGWNEEHAARMRLVALELMSLFPDYPADQIPSCLPTMFVRADSYLRGSAQPAPVIERYGFRRDQVYELAATHPHTEFFRLSQYQLRHPTFSGKTSDPVTRAAFAGGDAVTVLPYDPVRDQVLVVEQFRMGPYARGDAHPWCLECPAGRIDPGESPAETAIRECTEETGIHINKLVELPSYYPSPGAVTEYLYNFVGIADLPPDRSKIGGKADEGEDILSHVLPFDRLMELIELGEVDNGPLLVAALWLSSRRGQIT